ncbi:hypothetical protein J7M02_00040 [Candidatus Aerophobetes bacterium]|nr:hypothetical protein [Candidatus Aerophobetes bacterium]
MPILSSGLINSMDQLFVEALGEMREFMGRDVTIVNNTKINCPNCLLSYTEQESAGIYSPDDPYPSDVPGPIPFSGGFCPVCKNTGWYVIKNQENIKALISWASPGDRQYMEAGIIEPWDVSIQVSIDDADKVKNADEIYVDGQKVEFLNLRKEGLKTLAGATIELRKI